MGNRGHRNGGETGPVQAMEHGVEVGRRLIEIAARAEIEGGLAAGRSETQERLAAARAARPEPQRQKRRVMAGCHPRGARRRLAGRGESADLVLDGGAIVDRTDTPLQVRKTGFEANVFEFANQRSAIYGVIAILIALAAGWFAGIVFRNV